MLAIGFFSEGLVVGSLFLDRWRTCSQLAQHQLIYHRMAVRDSIHLNRSVISALTSASAARLPRAPNGCSYLTLNLYHMRLE